MPKWLPSSSAGRRALGLHLPLSSFPYNSETTTAVEKAHGGMRRRHRKDFFPSLGSQRDLSEEMISNLQSEGIYLVIQDTGEGRKREHGKYKG